MPTDEYQHLRERGLTQESVFRGETVKVRVDTVALPNGEIGQREIVEHPGSVAIVALTEADEVLLVRQFRYAIGRITLEIPAGTLSFGEQQDAAARRELHEETACQAATWQDLGEFYIAPGYATECIRVYLAQDLSFEGAALLDKDEFLETLRVPIEEALAMVKDGRIIDAKSIIGLTRLAMSRWGNA